MRDDFAVFILSHGRADNVKTLKSLQNANYTGKYFIFVDDEDSQYDTYVKNFGKEHIVLFSKKAMVGTFDLFDNFEQRNTVNFARNMCFRVAREKGIKYFTEFDDDYSQFTFRYLDDPEPGDTVPVLRSKIIKNIEPVFEAFVDFLDDTNVRCIAFAQAGEMMGGAKGNVWLTHVKRKSMNTFFFKVTDNPEEDVWFVGRMNDDVNTYVRGGILGELWFQISRINVIQEVTQKNNSGLSDMYRQFGTFNKSFYTVMLSPSSVKVGLIGPSDPRFHHSINWNLTVPKLLNERYKKK